MVERLRNWVYDIAKQAIRHETPKPKTNTAELVQLILDLHNSNWTMKSEKFLREQNIDPTPYWNKGKHPISINLERLR